VWGREVGDEEYRYWNFMPSAEHCGSITDWVVKCVEEVERMVEKGRRLDGLRLKLLTRKILGQLKK
jgi:hypothetical protein